MNKRVKSLMIIALLGLSVLIIPKISLATEKFYAPKLGVPIPGLDFKQATIEQNGKYLYIPFLAMYIEAFYKWLIGAGMVATAVICVYGGYLYLMGSTGLQVKDGKKKIQDAIIGMIILLAAYLILYNVNPKTIALAPLQIESIPEREFIFNEQKNSKNSTDLNDSPGSGYPTPAQGAAATPITSTTPSGSCNIPTDKGKVVFYQGVLASLTGKTYDENLKQTIDIVTSCNINLGFCGQVVNTIMALAGDGPTDCLLSKTKGVFCWSSFNDVKNFNDSIYWSNKQSALRGLHCNGDCAEKRSDCINSRSAAIATARTILTDDQNEIANKLQPGDWVYIWNANNDCNGNHSILFLGWKDPNSGIANAITGDVQHNPHFSTYCLKKSCGAYLPITQIMRPKQSSLRTGG